MSNKQKRLNIFRYGSKAMAKYVDGNSSLYYCPICGLGYPELSAVSGVDLTLEDVPPKSIGGKPLLLTCRSCNSSAGSAIDIAVANKRKFEDFQKIVCGEKKGTLPFVKLSLEDFHVSTSICTENSFDIMPLENANAPSVIEKYKRHLMNLSGRNGNDFKFELSVSHKYDSRLFKLSHLKSAFLMVFALLGYRYAFDPRLDAVRQQIREPQNDILGTRFWIEGNESMPLNKVMFLSSPLPIFLVSFNGFCIVLPSLKSEGDIYSSLSSYWERGQRITLQAKILDSWPAKLQMKLDYS